MPGTGHTCLERVLIIHVERVRQLLVKYHAQEYKGARALLVFEPTSQQPLSHGATRNNHLTRLTVQCIFVILSS